MRVLLAVLLVPWAVEAADDERDLGRVAIVGIVRCAEEGPPVAVAVDVADDVSVRRKDRRAIDET